LCLRAFSGFFVGLADSQIDLGVCVEFSDGVMRESGLVNVCRQVARTHYVFQIHAEQS
jgi:hypothetical protein